MIRTNSSPQSGHLSSISAAFGGFFFRGVFFFFSFFFFSLHVQMAADDIYKDVTSTMRSFGFALEVLNEHASWSNSRDEG